MAKADKKWESFEDAFRSIITDHKEFFGLDRVEPGPGTARDERDPSKNHSPMSCRISFSLSIRKTATALSSLNVLSG